MELKYNLENFKAKKIEETIAKVLVAIANELSDIRQEIWNIKEKNNSDD